MDERERTLAIDEAVNDRWWLDAQQGINVMINVRLYLSLIAQYNMKLVAALMQTKKLHILPNASR